MRTLLSILSCLSCLLPSPAYAQYVVKNVVFEGATPYSQADLAAASGIRAGQPLDQNGMSAAAQRLVDTGAFDDLQVTLDGPVKAITVIFKVKPVDPAKTVHVSLSNFVWWSPDELRTELHRRVPLFSAALPEAGDLQEQVRKALESMLVEKAVSAPKVEVSIREPRADTPFRTAVFAVTTSPVILRAVHVDGVSPAMSAVLTKELSGLIGNSYDEGVGAGSIADRIAAVFRNAGLLEASLTPLQRSVVASPSGGVDVSLSSTVNEGPVYRVTSITWGGSAVMDVTTFQKAAKLKAGDIASQKALRQTLDLLSSAYHNHGYMDVTVEAEPHMDAAAHTVSYVVRANSGEVYHLRTVSVDNLSPRQRTDFDAAWKLKPGDVYDEGYVGGFLLNNEHLSSLNGYRGAFKATANPADHGIDLTIVFTQNTVTVH